MSIGTLLVVVLWANNRLTALLVVSSSVFWMLPAKPTGPNVMAQVVLELGVVTRQRPSQSGASCKELASDLPRPDPISPSRTPVQIADMEDKTWPTHAKRG